MGPENQLPVGDNKNGSSSSVGNGSGGSNGTNHPNNGNDTEISSAASVKLPPFWTRCPSAWFFSVENEFTLRRITKDDRKFQYVLAALPEDIVMSVLDIIQNPGTDNRYAHLKSMLISRHSLSEEKRLAALFSKTEMGDQKPSEFYRHLELNAGDPQTFDRALLLKLWAARLPRDINIAILGSGKTSVEDVLPLADRIWEMSNISSLAALSVGNTHASVPPSSSTQIFGADTLVKVMTEVCQRFQSLEHELSELRSAVSRQSRNRFPQSQSRSHFRSSSNQRRFSRSGSRKPREEFCWYHNEFGVRATKCRPPCSFSKNSSGGGSDSTNC